MTYQQRYQQAHYNWQMSNHKDFYEQSGCYKATMPKIKTANGLTKFIIEYLKFDGWRATRISSAGRYIEHKNKDGHKLSGQFIPSTTRKGTADISATIKGRSVMIEIKVGNDKPSEFQLKEQQRERNAGGIYEFISTPDEFFLLYDKIMQL